MKQIARDVMGRKGGCGVGQMSYGLLTSPAEARRRDDDGVAADARTVILRASKLSVYFLTTSS